jgi:hypothetical protein
VAGLFAAAAARVGRAPEAAGGPPELILDVDLVDPKGIGVAVMAVAEALIPFDARERTRHDIEQRKEQEAGLIDRLT